MIERIDGTKNGYYFNKATDKELGKVFDDYGGTQNIRALIVNKKTYFAICELHAEMARHLIVNNKVPDGAIYVNVLR